MSGLKLRQASLSDARVLFTLRNHPQVREQSHNTEKLRFSDHQKWLENFLEDRAKCILIAEEDGYFIGMVRFEKAEDAYLMSWAISPEVQGQGFGKVVVSDAIDIMDGDVFSAEIKQNNFASIKIAEYIGMQLIKESKGVLFYQK